MVEDPGSLAKACFALSDQVVHGRDSGADFAHDFVWPHAARLGTLRSFSSLGQVSQPGYHERSHAILQQGTSRQRLVFAQTALERFHGSVISEIEVFQNLRRAPLPLGMALQALGAHAVGGGPDSFL